MSEPLLVRAARREPVERTPVWFMRQAGRSLPEYRELRTRHSFWEVAREPELCAEVTLQPVRRHRVDAAVMFADIMTPIAAMGVDVQLVEGVGPVIESFDAARLRVPDVVAPELAEAIGIVRRELPDERSEEHTSELQSHHDLVCRLLLEKKKKKIKTTINNEKKIEK